MVARFEELIRDEAKGEATPQELFLTVVDEALELRRFGRIEKLIRQAGLPLGISPHSARGDNEYRQSRREITPVFPSRENPWAQ